MRDYYGLQFEETPVLATVSILNMIYGHGFDSLSSSILGAQLNYQRDLYLVILIVTIAHITANPKPSKSKP